MVVPLREPPLLNFMIVFHDKNHHLTIPLRIVSNDTSKSVYDGVPWGGTPLYRYKIVSYDKKHLKKNPWLSPLSRKTYKSFLDSVQR